MANTASSLPELKLPSYHYSITNCCQFHCSHFHNGSGDIQSAVFLILITTLLHICFKTFSECSIWTTTIDLNSVLNIADMRFVSNSLSDLLKACLSTRSHECRAWKQGYQKCFWGRDVKGSISCWNYSRWYSEWLHYAKPHIQNHLDLPKNLRLA